MIQKADIFPANPKWSIEGQEYGSTWKTFVLTVIVLAASVAMSLTDLSQLWTDKSDLDIVETSLTGDGEIINPFVIGVRLSNNTYYPQLILDYTNGDKE